MAGKALPFQRMRARTTSPLESALGHRFRHLELLQQALTHSSHAREQESQNASEGGPAEVADNEQLEFLGDAVLGFVTSQELFQRYPHYAEGQLSKLRAYLVSGRHLVRVAKRLELGKYLRLGRGEEKSGGRSKSALLVDALEAVLAAVYLDAGLEPAREFIRSTIVQPEIDRLQQQGDNGFPLMDYKSALQESVHAMGRAQPSYVLVKEEGPEHKKMFTVEARIHLQGGHGRAEYVARARGSTKKKAEQDAARQALEYLQSLQPTAEDKGTPRHSSR
jgi:ribonuclease-3